jgi:hypothetical protein
MGSTGTGRFTDYTGTKANKPGGSGGSSGEDQCDESIEAVLEDVERCAYYEKNKKLPAVGTDISVSIVKRLNITIGGETLGYLPTKYNYLAGCVKGGAKYSGKVTSISSKPIIKVSIELNRI